MAAVVVAVEPLFLVHYVPLGFRSAPRDWTGAGCEKGSVRSSVRQFPSRYRLP